MQIDIWDYYRDKKKLYVEDFVNINIWDMED